MNIFGPQTILLNIPELRVINILPRKTRPWVADRKFEIIFDLKERFAGSLVLFFVEKFELDEFCFQEYETGHCQPMYSGHHILVIENRLNRLIFLISVPASLFYYSFTRP